MSEFEGDDQVQLVDAPELEDVISPGGNSLKLFLFVKTQISSAPFDNFLNNKVLTDTNL